MADSAHTHTHTTQTHKPLIGLSVVANSIRMAQQNNWLDCLLAPVCVYYYSSNAIICTMQKKENYTVVQSKRNKWEQEEKQTKTEREGSESEGKKRPNANFSIKGLRVKEKDREKEVRRTGRQNSCSSQNSLCIQRPQLKWWKTKKPKQWVCQKTKKCLFYLLSFFEWTNNLARNSEKLGAKCD